MGWLRRKKQENKKSTEAEVSKPTIYFATRDGITNDGTGGLFAYRENVTKDRMKALDDVRNALKTSGFDYKPSIGLIFKAESKEVARNKLLEQKNNIISESDLDILEESWIEEQKEKNKAEKSKEKEVNGEEEEANEEPENLKNYGIPEEIKKILAGKTGVEVKHGINVDYEKAVKGLHEWK